MFKAEIYIYDESEHVAFLDFHYAILAHRRAKAVTFGDTEPGQRVPEHDVQLAAEIKAVVAEGEVLPDGPAPEGPANARPEGNMGPLVETVENAVKRFYSAVGFAKTRALLDKYNAPRAGDVKPEDRQALLEEIERSLTTEEVTV